MLHVSHAKALSRIGADVIRFSSTPDLRGRPLIIELHAMNEDLAIGSVTFFGGGPTNFGSVKVYLTGEEYTALSSSIDELLSKGEPQEESPQELPDGSIKICIHGPGYVTERRVNGRSSWMSGSCGEQHPNQEISRLMIDAAKTAVGRLWPER